MTSSYIDLKFNMMCDEIFCLYCGKEHVWYTATPGSAFKISKVWKKSASEWRQRRQRYGNIVILYNMINIYEWYICYIWQQLYYRIKSLRWQDHRCFQVPRPMIVAPSQIRKLHAMQVREAMQVCNTVHPYNMDCSHNMHDYTHSYCVLKPISDVTP